MSPTILFLEGFTPAARERLIGCMALGKTYRRRVPFSRGRCRRWRLPGARRRGGNRPPPPGTRKRSSTGFTPELPSAKWPYSTAWGAQQPPRVRAGDTSPRQDSAYRPARCNRHRAGHRRAETFPPRHEPSAQFQRLHRLRGRPQGKALPRRRNGQLAHARSAQSRLKHPPWRRSDKHDLPGAKHRANGATVFVCNATGSSPWRRSSWNFPRANPKAHAGPDQPRLLFSSNSRRSTKIISAAPALKSASTSNRPRSKSISMRLQRVLQNLMTNAVEALRSTPKPKLDIKAQVKNGAFLLTVKDNGPRHPLPRFRPPSLSPSSPTAKAAASVSAWLWCGTSSQRMVAPSRLKPHPNAEQPSSSASRKRARLSERMTGFRARDGGGGGADPFG